MSEGLSQLAESEKARVFRRSARTLKFNSIYSRDIDQIKSDYKLAEKYEEKARMLGGRR